MVDLLERLALLTTIERKDLVKLFEKLNWCICDSLHDSNVGGIHKCSFDIGIGVLMLDYSTGDAVKYKFVPSEELNKEVNETLVSGKNPLDIRVEQALVRKITTAYKDLF